MTETTNLFGLKPHIPSFFWSRRAWLTFWAPPLQNPTPGIPIAELGNVFRQLTGAKVHPSQAEASWWGLHGMGGDTNAANNSAYGTAFALFGVCKPYTQCAPYTACMVYTECTPYADWPLHSCALYAGCDVACASHIMHGSYAVGAMCAASVPYAVRAVCAAYVLYAVRAAFPACRVCCMCHVCCVCPVCCMCRVPHMLPVCCMLHIQHLAFAPYDTCSACAFCTQYGACAPYAACAPHLYSN
jgi:hypothetical protein